MDRAVRLRDSRLCRFPRSAGAGCVRSAVRPKDDRTAAIGACHGRGETGDLCRRLYQLHPGLAQDKDLEDFSVVLENGGIDRRPFLAAAAPGYRDHANGSWPTIRRADLRYCGRSAATGEKGIPRLFSGPEIVWRHALPREQNPIHSRESFSIASERCSGGHRRRVGSSGMARALVRSQAREWTQPRNLGGSRLDIARFIEWKAWRSEPVYCARRGGFRYRIRSLRLQRSRSEGTRGPRYRTGAGSAMTISVERLVPRWSVKSLRLADSKYDRVAEFGSDYTDTTMCAVRDQRDLAPVAGGPYRVRCREAGRARLSPKTPPTEHSSNDPAAVCASDASQSRCNGYQPDIGASSWARGSV